MLCFVGIIFFLVLITVHILEKGAGTEKALSLLYGGAQGVPPSPGKRTDSWGTGTAPHCSGDTSEASEKLRQNTGYEMSKQNTIPLVHLACKSDPTLVEMKLRHLTLILS